jgi:hypothetical protein
VPYRSVDVVQDWGVTPDPVAPKVHSGVEADPLTAWFAMGGIVRSTFSQNHSRGDRPKRPFLGVHKAGPELMPF